MKRALALIALLLAATAATAQSPYDQRVRMSNMKLGAEYARTPGDQFGRAANVTAKAKTGTGLSNYSNTRYVSKALKLRAPSAGRMATKMLLKGVAGGFALEAAIKGAGWIIERLQDDIEIKREVGGSCADGIWTSSVGGGFLQGINGCSPDEVMTKVVQQSSGITDPWSQQGQRNGRPYYIATVGSCGSGGCPVSVGFDPDGEHEGSREPVPDSEVGRRLLQNPRAVDALERGTTADRDVANEWPEWRNLRDRLTGALDGSGNDIASVDDPDLISAPSEPPPSESARPRPQEVEVEIPTDCDLFEPGCEIRDWLTEDEPSAPRAPNVEINRQELGIGDFDVDNRLPGGGSCPSDVVETIRGRQVTVFSWQPICQLMIKTRPVVIAGGWLIAILIVGRIK